MTKSVALVHDYLLVMRGAERTFAAIAECWPDAPIYTLLYDEEGTDGVFAHRDVRTSALQRLGIRQNGFRSLLPAFPRATRALPLEDYDLVVSSSSAFAHGVLTANEARHVCYCHSPFRYAWFETERALADVAVPLRPALRTLLGVIRRNDLAAARRVTRYVANSALTRERIAKYWGRPSSIVHPPVEVERFRPGIAEDWVLIVSELVRHKQVDLALEATRRARVKVRVVGDGPEFDRLRSRYGAPNGDAEFLGRVDDARLSELYASARAFLVPNVEEFGIAAVEAQAAGCPVVAIAAGGALETVIDGETGVHVPAGDIEALAKALVHTDFARFNRNAIARHAQRFSKESFKESLRHEVDSTGALGGQAAIGLPLGTSVSISP